MNTLNPLLVSAKSNNLHNQFTPSVFSQQPLNSFSFKNPLPLSLKVSSSSPSSFENSKILNSKPFNSLISTITATAVLFLTGFYFNPKKAICAPVEPQHTMETNVKDAVSKAEEEEIEKGIVSNLNDVEILRKLLETRVKNRELDDALSIINKLIELEPHENDWRFLKSHLYVHNGEVELAKLGFREIISNDPYYVEAYRGLVVAALEDEESVDEMKEIEKTVEEGINLYKEENKECELRDLRLLLAQIWVTECKYDEALKAYQVLVDEDPLDFRPYLCLGMIYTVLKKNDEAETYLEKYRELVPQERPNAKFEFIKSTL
ncbi:unnamed protein product [Withania somnifera]